MTWCACCWVGEELTVHFHHWLSKASKSYNIRRSALHGKSWDEETNDPLGWERGFLRIDSLTRPSKEPGDWLFLSQHLHTTCCCIKSIGRHHIRLGPLINRLRSGTDFNGSATGRLYPRILSRSMIWRQDTLADLVYNGIFIACWSGAEEMQAYILSFQCCAYSCI